MSKKYLALVVEDDPDLSMIFASALSSVGFEIEIINDGAKALDRLVEVAPSLVILDLHLPHLSGANTLRQIHSDRRLLDTRVVICTADAVMAEELRDQADLVLLKPLMYSQLRDLAVRLVPGVEIAAAAAKREQKSDPGVEIAPAAAKQEQKPDPGVEIAAAVKQDQKPDPDLSPLPGP